MFMNKNNVIGRSLEHSYKDVPSDDLNARIMASVIKIADKKAKQEKMLMILIPTIFSLLGISYLVYTNYTTFESVFSMIISINIMYYIYGAIALGFVLLSDYFMKKSREKLKMTNY